MPTQLRWIERPPSHEILVQSTDEQGDNVLADITYRNEGKTEWAFTTAIKQIPTISADSDVTDTKRCIIYDLIKFFQERKHQNEEILEQLESIKPKVKGDLE